MLMRRLRDQDGMTLPEMLVAISMALIVSLATFSLIEFTMRRSAEISGRVDANQRGRVAMETITRQLRSQVCQPSGTPPIFSRAGNVTDGNGVTFFVDFTDGSQAATTPVDMHTIRYVPPTAPAVAGTIVEQDYTGTLGANASIDPTYSATPYRTRTLLTDVVPVSPGAPIFRYYLYNSTTPLATPVTGSALGSIASIQIAYRALPSRSTTTTARGNVVFQDLVTVREVDPNATNPAPQCA
jgi:prepilin-type N-terminal cleavage/methylation domain-containing protein